MNNYCVHLYPQLVLVLLLLSLESSVFSSNSTKSNTFSKSGLVLDYGDSSEEIGESTTTSEPRPIFNPDNSKNVTVHLGSTAFLHCRVTQILDKTVSWVKQMKGNGTVRLLTTGLHTFSNDDRLSINFEQPDNWKLRLANVDRTDAGTYACQVSSHPPSAFYITLTIIVPKISLVDDLGRKLTTDKYYNAGSTVELRCVLSQLPPSYTILWRHGNLTFNYDASRGGISVKTTMGKAGSAVSSLHISKAKANDSGPYTCAVGNLIETTILIHVIKGETPAAMQHSNSGWIHYTKQPQILLVLQFLGSRVFHVVFSRRLLLDES